MEQTGKETVDNDKDTIISSKDKDKASSNTVTIDAKEENDKVEVKLDNVNIDTSKQNKAAVSVTGSGNTTIELDGSNTLKSGSGHAGLEHNKTDTSGELTIQDNNKDGSLDAAGGRGGAGIGGGMNKDGQVTITDGDITANGGKLASGIGGGHGGSGHVTITGDATVKEAQGFGGGAGIGSGIYGPIGDVEISGNANVERAIGSDLGAGVGAGYGESGLPNVGKVTIKDNAKIGLAQGGAGAAGIGGGYYESYIPEEDTSSSGVGDVTIEGNTTVNAVGGEGAAGIGGGVNALTVGSDDGNKITIRGNETGTPTVNATGGAALTDEDGNKVGPGGAGIGSGAGDAKANITLEGKVTITATAGKDNVAIGDKNGEQEFNGLAEGSSITRYDSKGNGITLPTDPGYPVPADTSSSGGGSSAPSAPASFLPGLTVTDKDGQRISYTSTQSGNTLTVCVGRFTASLRISLATLCQLRAEGIETITFQTILCSTTLSVDELLAMGGEDAEVVLTHHIRSSTLTVGGKAV